MPVRAITFDYWMTLFREQDRDVRHEHRAEAFCRATGAPQADVSRALKAAHDYFFQVHVAEQRTLEPIDAVRMVCRDLDLSISDSLADELAHAFGTSILVYPPGLI